MIYIKRIVIFGDTTMTYVMSVMKLYNDSKICIYV